MRVKSPPPVGASPGQVARRRGSLLPWLLVGSAFLLPPPAYGGVLARFGIGEAVEHLKSGDLPTRVRAAKELGASGDPAAVEALLGQLVRENRAEVRVAMVGALGRLGDRRASAAVLELLAAPDKAVRMAAARAAVAVAGSAALAPLSAALLDDEVATAAARGLAELGPPGRAALLEALRHGGLAADAAARGLARGGVREAVPAIIEAVGGGRVSVAVGAEVLGGLHDTRATPVLCRLLFDADPSARRQALHAISAMRDPAATAALVVALSQPSLRRGTLDALARWPEIGGRLPSALLSLLGDPDPRLRQVAATALVGASGGEAGQVDAALLRLLEHDAVARQSAAAALADRAQHGSLSSGRGKTSTRETGALLAGLLGHPDAQVATAAAVALGGLASSGDGRATKALIALVDGPPGPLAYVAAAALAGARAPASLPALLRYFERGDLRDRRLLADRLGGFESRQAALNLRSALADDRDLAVRAHAAWGLGRLGDRAALAALLAAVEEQHFPLSGNAAYALAMLDERAALPALRLALAAAEPHLRANAALAVGRLGDRSSLGALRRLAAGDSSPLVRRSAERARLAMGDLGKVEVARGEVANGDVGEGEEKGESRVAAAAAAGGGRHGGRDRDSVAVRLLDDSGQPARGVRYLLELPDGWAKGGLSDELGGVVETLAPAGDCWLTLQ